LGTALTAVLSDPALSEGARPIATSDRLPLPERARLLALGRRLLEALPNPSAARELALELVRELEDVEAGVGAANERS
jgi:hypothetical protein